MLWSSARQTTHASAALLAAPYCSQLQAQHHRRALFVGTRGIIYKPFSSNNQRAQGSAPASRSMWAKFRGTQALPSSPDCPISSASLRLMRRSILEHNDAETRDERPKTRRDCQPCGGGCDVGYESVLVRESHHKDTITMLWSFGRSWRRDETVKRKRRGRGALILSLALASRER